MKLAVALALLGLLATPALAQLVVAVPPIRTVATLGTCTDGSPKIVAVTDGASSSDCTTGSGTTDVYCGCKDGVWSAIGSIGGSTGATDNALLRADGTGGATAQGSVDTIDDTTGRFNFPASWSMGPATDYTNYFALVNSAPRFHLQTAANDYTSAVVALGVNVNGGSSGAYLRGYSGFPSFNNSTYCFGWGSASTGNPYSGATRFCMNGDKRVGLWDAPAKLDVYGTSTDSSNYERLSLSTTAGSSVTLAAETAGTGADNLDILLKPAGTGTVQAYGQGSYPEDQVQIGPGAIARSSADNAGSVAIGRNAQASNSGGNGSGGVAIGDGSSALANSNGTAVGRATSAGNDGSSAFGYASGASGLNAFAAGNTASAAGNYSIAIGRVATAAAGNTASVAIGLSATTTAANQFVLGGSDGTGQVTDGYFGSGVVDDAPKNFALNATGGSGTNIAGASLTLAGGKGTGTGAPGAVNISTSTVGTTGTTLQTLSARVTVTAGGGVILVPLASPPETCDAGHEGEMYSDTSHALCWCDGTTWTKLAGAGTCA